eukprot:g11609.t1
MAQQGLLTSLVAFVVNVPLGWAVTARYERFSPGWFLGVHASVPLIIVMRRRLMVPRYFVPLNIGCAISGQYLGILQRRKALLPAVVSQPRPHSAAAP